jgi:eukaryotic-like serine/threonine-protein kinase
MADRRILEQWARVDALLDRVLAQPVDERVAFVERETAGDPSLRQEVLALVSGFDTRGDTLDRPAMDRIAGRAGAIELPAGHRIGAYRIVSLLGRGGMGEVYRAERADGQFEQQVALKLLRPDAVQHLGRFIVERGILARLEHPGIARLYDAGVADDGRPYMVMELIDGTPITQWCRQANAALHQRLDLFLQVCDAVAYAHQNLVVHRDLKPGNVIVSRDGHVKLLDFGVAKLLTDTDEPAPDTPMTLAYAAPEQLTGAEVTTASDVYSLGMLLFELLTERVPWQAGQLPTAVTVEKLLRENVPAPSMVAEGHSPISARQLTGDLDAIVAKALRKQPHERYATVVGLHNDIRRHLRGDTVAARGTSRAYLLRHFLRRHRWPVVAVLALFLVLAAGLAGTIWQAREAARERDIARTEAARSDAVRDYVTLMFREAGEDAGEGELTAKQVLDRSAANLIADGSRLTPQRAGMFQMLGELYAAIDDYEGAAPIFRGYLKAVGPGSDPAMLAEVRHDAAISEFLLGNPAKARLLLAQAQGFWNRDPHRYADSLASSRVIQSRLQRDQGDIDGAIRTLRAGLADRIAISGRSDRETAYIMNALALALMDAGQLQEADRVLGECLQIMAALGKQDTGNALTMLSNQAVIVARLGDYARAEPLFQHAAELRRRLYGRSAALAAMQQNLAKVMMHSGRTQAARPLLVDALSMAREFTGERSLTTLTIMLSVAEVEIALNEATADHSLQQALQAIAAQFGAQHVLYARGEQLLAHLRLHQGRRADALAAVNSAQRKLEALGQAGAPYLVENQSIRSQLGVQPGAASTH